MTIFDNQPEKFLTMKEVAAAVGCHYWQISRAVGRGELPFYQPFNSRKLLLLSEVRAHIATSRKAGVE
jgi:excisionase family DNA binding protein